MKKKQEIIQFHAAQAEIASDPHRYRVVNCGRRFGKTFLAVQEMIGTATNLKDGRICYIAPNFQQARDIAWDDLKKHTNSFAIKTNESRLEVIVPSRYPRRNHITKELVLTKDNKPIYEASTSKIILRGWEAVESLRGQKFHFLIPDEVSTYSDFDNKWKTILLPTLTDYRGRVLFLSTPKGFNHFYQLYNLDKQDKSFKSFHFPSRSNPHLPIEDLEGYKNIMSVDQYAQEYEAEFRKKEGLVFTDFNRQHHTYTPEDLTHQPNFRETFYGIDFGFTNPSAVLVIQKDNDSNYFITDCLYEKQLTNTQLIEKTKQLSPQPRQIYADPAEPDRIKEFKDAGYYMREVKKGKGSIINGIQRLEELFRTNRIKINATTCMSLINELEMYSYPPHKDGRNDSENPVDENNHLIDALSYALRTHDPHSHGRGSLFTPHIKGGTEIQNELARRVQQNKTTNRRTLLR